MWIRFDDRFLRQTFKFGMLQGPYRRDKKNNNLFYNSKNIQ